MTLAGTHLQADGNVHPAAERGADGARRQAQVFEDLGEGLGERDARPLLRHHHARAHAGQVDVAQLWEGKEEWEVLESKGKKKKKTPLKLFQTLQ